MRRDILFQMDRSVKLMTALAALIATATVVPSAAEPAATGSSRAAIKLASDTPLTVSGRGFRPSERVVVTVYNVGGTYSKAVTASRSGKFLARFPRADGSCGPLTARATGSRGSRASLKHIPIPPPCIPIQP